MVGGCGQSFQIPPTTVATGTNAHSIDDVGLWVKSEYHSTSPEVPPYLTNQPPVIAAAQLHGLFTSHKYPVDVRRTDYRYCNLPNAFWVILRGQSPSKYPVLWSPAPDSAGQRLVVSVDFKTDLFWPAYMPEPSFRNDLSRMELAIRKETGETNFSLLRFLDE